MFADSSCITRWRIRCEPVRWTSTLMPGYAASNSLATCSALVSTSEVYQTTLPSFLAASRRVSGVWAPPAVARPASSAAATTTAHERSVRRLIGWSPRSSGWLGGQRVDQGAQPRRRGQRVDGAHDGVGAARGQRQRRVATELRLDLRARQRRVGAAARAVLPLAQGAAVGERDLHVADELPRVVDGRIDLVRHAPRHA